MPDKDKAEEETGLRTFHAKATDPTRVGVWDVHPAHPNDEHEVFVSGERVVEVAATPVVLDALAKGRIVEVSGHAAAHKQPSEGPAAQAAVGGDSPAEAARRGR